MAFFERTITFFTEILNAIVPPRHTDTHIHEISLTTLLRLRKPLNYGEHITFLFPYKHKTIAALVWEIKYHRNPKALRMGSEALVEELLSISEESLAIPLLIPIPMHKRRQNERGFNACEELCAEIVRLAPESFQIEANALQRIRETVPQLELPRKKRLQNVHHSMVANETARERTCIVLDDVTTTGATFREARRALLHAGAKEVYCVALAG